MSWFRKRSVSSQASPDSPLGRIYATMHKNDEHERIVVNLRSAQKAITIIGIVFLLIGYVFFIVGNDITTLSTVNKVIYIIGFLTSFMAIAAAWFFGIGKIFNRLREKHGVEKERVQDIFPPRQL